MAKIKKRGLDYFPVNTDFLQSRLMRRIMKREGDVAPTALLQVYSAVYAGEGYYVVADSLFYDDLADCFYRLEPDAVERIIALAVEYGLFDAALFSRYGILTSADIQRQFLFSKRRRTPESIDPRYRLLPAEGETEGEGGSKCGSESEDEGDCPAPESVSKSGENVSKDVTFSGKSVTSASESVSGNVTSSPEKVTPVLDEMGQNRPESVTFQTENVTFSTENDGKAHFGTHSIEQDSKEQQSKAEHSAAEQSKEHPLLNVSPETGGGGPAAARGREEPAGRGEDDSSGKALGGRADAGTASFGTVPAVTAPPGATDAGHPVSDKSRRTVPREWTLADIDRLQAPSDGQRRNLDGLRISLRQFNVPPREQYAIILKSNFGVIGHPMWKGFNALRESHGKIRLPGHYLLSLCK